MLWVVALLACAGAVGRDTSLPTLELTPFAGYRLGGDFELSDSGAEVGLEDRGAFALAVNLPIDELSQYELFYGRQNTSLRTDSPLGSADVDVEYLHLGGMLIVSEVRRVAPYLVGGLGATRITPDAAGARSETRFSFSLGAGLRAPLGRRVALRLEARGFLTFLDTRSAIFCVSDELGGLCRVRAKGDAFFQYEFLAGAAFAF